MFKANVGYSYRLKKAGDSILITPVQSGMEIIGMHFIRQPVCLSVVLLATWLCLAVTFLYIDVLQTYKHNYWPW